MRKKLSDEQVQQRLALLPEWRQEGHIILRRFAMDSFPAALLFVNAIGHIAEKLDHHPDLLIQWKQVIVSISTHDAGGLTEKDFQLAERINSLL